ncbi:MAG: hypothetical protein K0S20_779 [Patescibacteria group bacterium]|jgi:hypothetical protein|nr:hypothetical protein [Patescibacteria group bacterium]
MEKPASRIIPLIYGYLVCLISIVVALVSLSMLINAIFNLSNPLLVNDYRFGANNLYTFESYKNEILTNKAYLNPEGQTAVSPSSTDEELRTAYEDAKTMKTAGVRFDSQRTITNSIILMVIALGLFIGHWRWLGRTAKATE